MNRKKIKTCILNNRYLSVLYYAYKNRDNENFKKWVVNFDNPNIVEYQCLGQNNPEKTIYVIEFQDDKLGFFGLWKQGLERLDYAEHFNFTPIIFWGENTPYYEKELGINAFENYFERVSNIDYQNAMNSQRVIISRGPKDRSGFFSKEAYALSDEELDKYIHYNKKYIHIKKDIEDQILSGYEAITKGKKTLAVHVRGVEWGNIVNHPIPIGLEKYEAIIDSALNENGFELVFLATDSEDTINYLSSKYGEKIVYYSDVARAKIGSHTLAIFDSNNSTPMKRYNMGYEVLRDMYSLSCAEGLVAGYSNISLAANVWKKMRGESYELMHIMKLEINQKGMSVKKAVKQMREGTYK